MAEPVSVSNSDILEGLARKKPFKRIDQPTHLDQVIRGVLDVLPEGRTNIGIGLSAGLEELRRSHIQNKIGILLTDGWQNIGQDPISIALKYPQLHVINLPGGHPVLSRKISQAGKGVFYTHKRYA
jgi:hypothetical protein